MEETRETHLKETKSLLEQRIEIIEQEKLDIEKERNEENGELMDKALRECDVRINEVTLFLVHIQSKLLDEILKNKYGE